MRIGIDFDGVITHTMPAMVAYAARQLDMTLTELECMRPAGPLRLGEEGYLALIRDTHETPYALTFAPTNGLVDAMTHLRADHELFVVTNRAGAALDRAEEWLAAHGVRSALAAVVHASTGSGKVEAARRLKLDVMLDDWPENLGGLDAATRRILWSAAYNMDAAIPPRVRRVDGWDSFIEAIATP